jgi:hypothetical protein
MQTPIAASQIAVHVAPNVVNRKGDTDRMIAGDTVLDLALFRFERIAIGWLRVAMYMKKLIALVLLSCIALSAIATQVPKGADIRLSFDQELSSKTAKIGDKVAFHVVDDVLVDGQVVIKKGTAAVGTVTDVAKGRRFGVNARMKIRLDPVAAVDGTLIPIAARQKGKMTGGSTDKAAIASGAGALVLGPIGLGAGYFITGKNIFVKSGDTMTTEVTTATEVKLTAPSGVQDTGKSAGGA